MLLIPLSVSIIISLTICIYNILRTLSPKSENTEWQGVWRDLGETLERWTSSVSWNFTPEHLQDPESLSRYLGQGCCGSDRSEEAQIIWGLAYAYWALFNTIPERERGREPKLKRLSEPKGRVSKREYIMSERVSKLRGRVSRKESKLRGRISMSRKKDS